MKKFTTKRTQSLAILLFMLCFNSFAQEGTYHPKTLFGGGDKSVRAYIGFNSKGLLLNDQVATMGGIELTLVLGHRVNIGVIGYGKTNQVQSNFVDNFGFKNYYELGLGGFKIEPVLFTNSLVHLTIPVQFGGGGISLSRYSFLNYNDYNTQYVDWESGLHDFDTFVFVEPSVSAEINLFKHLRLNAGVGYMLTDNINLAGTKTNPIEGFTGNLSLRLGWF